MEALCLWAPFENVNHEPPPPRQSWYQPATQRSTAACSLSLLAKQKVSVLFELGAGHVHHAPHRPGVL
eukprot:520727-Rhodomonas_salina.1